MNILKWLTEISGSTTAGDSFHAKWLYVVCAVFGPAIIGALITYTIMFLERVFKIHIGGH